MKSKIILQGIEMDLFLCCVQNAKKNITWNVVKTISSGRQKKEKRSKYG